MVVHSFAEKHSLDASREAALLEHTMSLARAARLMPVATLSVNVTAPEEDGVPGNVTKVAIPIYEGDSVRQQAEAKAKQHPEFPPDVVSGLVEAAVAEGKRNRLEPLEVFNVTVGEEEHK